MTISLYDAIMLAIVFFAVIQGAYRGMAWQLAPIASLVLGYMFAVPLSASTAPWFGEPPLNRVFAMITMYILVSLGVYLIARAMRESIERTKMVEFDRHLGAILGGVKGVLFTVVLTIGLVCVSPTAAALIVHPETRTVAEYVIKVASPLLPTDIHEVIDPYLKPIENLPDEPNTYTNTGRKTPSTSSQAKTVKETATTRTRKHDAIYEDDDTMHSADPAGTLDDGAPVPRRRRTSDADPSDSLTNRPRRSVSRNESSDPSLPEDDSFQGADPNQLADEPPKSLRR